MDELNPNAKALLDAVRGASSPSAAEVSALRERLGLLPPPPPPATAPEPAPASTIVRRLVVGGIAAAAATAAIVAATASTPTVSRLDPLATFVPQRTSTPMPQSPQPSPARPQADLPAERVPPSATPSPLPHSRRPAKRAAKTEKPHEGSDLQAELALIVKARKALAGGKDAAAKTSAQQYTRTFPRGAFREEAEVLGFIASCNLGGTEATKRRARSYVERGTPSFAQRVQKACLEPRD